MTGALPRVGRFVHAHAVLLGAMAVSAAATLVVRAAAFPYYSANRDEPVYVLQAKALAQGHLTLPRYDHLAFFQPWLTGPVDGRLVFEFSPGTALILAISHLLTTSMMPALVVVAALTTLAVYCVALEASERRGVAQVAAALAALSPILLLQNATFLSYTPALCAGAFAAYAILRGSRTASAVPLAVGGALLGFVAMVRPLDAVLWGIPFVTYAAVRARPGWRTAGSRVGWIALGALGPTVLHLAFNAAVTGNPFQLPLRAAAPQNTPGFGERAIMSGARPLVFTRHDGFEAAGTMFEQSPPWVLGGFAGLALALAGVWIARRRGTTYPLLALFATFGLGYVNYWSIVLMADGAPVVGPHCARRPARARARQLPGVRPRHRGPVPPERDPLRREPTRPRRVHAVRRRPRAARRRPRGPHRPDAVPARRHPRPRRRHPARRTRRADPAPRGTGVPPRPARHQRRRRPRGRCIPRHRRRRPRRRARPGVEAGSDLRARVDDRGAGGARNHEWRRRGRRTRSPLAHRRGAVRRRRRARLGRQSLGDAVRGAARPAGIQVVVPGRGYRVADSYWGRVFLPSTTRPAQAVRLVPTG